MIYTPSDTNVRRNQWYNHQLCPAPLSVFVVYPVVVAAANSYFKSVEGLDQDCWNSTGLVQFGIVATDGIAGYIKHFPIYSHH